MKRLANALRLIADWLDPTPPSAGPVIDLKGRGLVWESGDIRRVLLSADKFRASLHTVNPLEHVPKGAKIIDENGRTLVEPEYRDADGLTYEEHRIAEIRAMEAFPPGSIYPPEDGK